MVPMTVIPILSRTPSSIIRMSFLGRLTAFRRDKRIWYTRVGRATPKYNTVTSGMKSPHFQTIHEANKLALLRFSNPLRDSPKPSQNIYPPPLSTHLPRSSVPSPDQDRHHLDQLPRLRISHSRHTAMCPREFDLAAVCPRQVCQFDGAGLFRGGF
jgi:hypothetical protein